MSAGTDIPKRDRASRFKPFDIVFGTGYHDREHEETLNPTAPIKPPSASEDWEYELQGGYLGPVKTLDEHRELGNSTILQEPPEEIGQEIEALFIKAREERFEDGMESDFSSGLISMIRMCGNAAIEVIAKLILYERVNPEVASEALRWIGHIEQASTYTDRLWLLERSLRCSSARVRDGVALGLASLDDPHAIPYLKQAIQREQCEELREDMEQVLAQLLESEC